MVIFRMVGRPGKYATLFGGRQEEVNICLIWFFFSDIKKKSITDFNEIKKIKRDLGVLNADLQSDCFCCRSVKPGAA